MDMQKDTIVHSISTVMLEPTGGNRVVHIDNIKNTAVNGMELGLGGYLDIGLIDTMKRLILSIFIGAVVFSIIGFLYVKQRGKGKFANRFIPRIKDENADFLKIVEEDRKAEKVQKEDSDSNP